MMPSVRPTSCAPSDCTAVDTRCSIVLGGSGSICSPSSNEMFSTVSWSPRASSEADSGRYELWIRSISSGERGGCRHRRGRRCRGGSVCRRGTVGWCSTSGWRTRLRCGSRRCGVVQLSSMRTATDKRATWPLGEIVWRVTRPTS